MITASLRTGLLKWIVAVLLAAMVLGAAAMAYLPVQGYSVTCKKSEMIICELQRETSSDHGTWQAVLGTSAIAAVKIQPRRRGSARVLLYLSSSSQTIFAAEFEGGSALAEAEAAAAQLNRVFSSEIPASVHVVAHPPGYFRWLIWAGIGLLVVFVLVIYRELFKPGASDQ
ncbi:hypothetical protein BH11PSE14_BH11PSE14_11500 [soil metagenome]